jgi:hypothetical protein
MVRVYAGPAPFFPSWNPKFRQYDPVLIKLKGNSVPVLLLTVHHAMKAYLGSGSIAPLIL